MTYANDLRMGTVILDTSKTVATKMEIQFLNTNYVSIFVAIVF